MNTPTRIEQFVRDLQAALSAKGHKIVEEFLLVPEQMVELTIKKSDGKCSTHSIAAVEKDVFLGSVYQEDETDDGDGGEWGKDETFSTVEAFVAKL